MSSPRRVSAFHLVLALICLLPAGWGALWAFSGDEGGQALGFALLGFFGAGAFVLARRAFADS
ncbi:hypothetical protein [Nocardioides ochotonae]|uniref:hypothetical protein n=1 Tax=Nocardioides ochotonae TaxID=2685869 RepID=UPI001407DEBB|nr:hypothetical protein [Nocardioides ochotonae]